MSPTFLQALTLWPRTHVRPSLIHWPQDGVYEAVSVPEFLATGTTREEALLAAAELYQIHDEDAERWEPVIKYLKKHLESDVKFM